MLEVLDSIIPTSQVIFPKIFTRLEVWISLWSVGCLEVTNKIVSVKAINPDS